MTDQASASSGTPISSARSLWLAHLLLVVAIVLYLVNVIFSIPWTFTLFTAGSTGLMCESNECEIAPDGLRNYWIPLNSPAYRAGIREGGTLIAIDGQPVNQETFSQFEGAFGALDPLGEAGTTSTLTIVDPAGITSDYTIIRERGWAIGWVNLLQGIGVSNGVATALRLVPILLVHSFCLGSAVVMYLRGRKRWLPIYLSALLILLPVFTALYSSPAPEALYIATITYVLMGFIGCTALFIFPDGKWVPRWGWLISALSSCVYLMNHFNENFLLLGNSLFLIGLAAQFHRYRIAAPEVRQAQKWIAYGLTLGIFPRVINNMIVTPIHQMDNLPTALLIAVAAVDFISIVGLIFIPITLSFAVMRYRLWDVDLVINRSMVGAIVTATLILVFLAGFFMLQTGLQAAVGSEQSTLAATISVGLVLLVFNPVHRQVRHFIDRRLYGFRFDLYALKQPLPSITHPGALSGKTLGEFHIRNLIGKGGMGEVYQAHADGKTIAIKIMPVDAVRDPLFRQRMEREAQALAALDHPNIVHFYGAGESNGIYFIALEFVQGDDLKALLETRGKFSWDEVRGRVDEVASALNHAHERGMVHRDIKPANIMLRRNPESDTTDAVLMDFGIVKILDADTQITGTGSVFGTIDYMAPEQILNSKEVDHRADIYAMGIVLYELLTGERPFKGSQGQVLFAHLQQPAPNPRSVNVQIPPSVARSIMKALEKEPKARHASAAAFAETLMNSVAQ
jgi:tRNA A-37 threonylcarbamoyl transferase component Bud32